MKYQFEIINREDNSVFSCSYSFTHIVMNGTQEREEEFEGYKTWEIAEMWAKDRMILYNLSEETHFINIISKDGHIKERNHTISLKH